MGVGSIDWALVPGTPPSPTRVKLPPDEEGVCESDPESCVRLLEEEDEAERGRRRGGLLEEDKDKTRSVNASAGKERGNAQGAPR